MFVESSSCRCLELSEDKMCITPDVAATFTSHAPGRRRQHVFEFFAAKMKMWNKRHQVKTIKAQ